jgi:uncharacterized integral membrane protein
MRLLFWILGLPLLVLVALFAVANREPVAINLWPFASGFDMPLYAALGVALYAGIALGALVAWLAGGRNRSRRRAAVRRAAALERENETLKSRLGSTEEARTPTPVPVSTPVRPGGAPPLPSFLP